MKPLTLSDLIKCVGEQYNRHATTRVCVDVVGGGPHICVTDLKSLCDGMKKEARKNNVEDPVIDIQINDEDKFVVKHLTIIGEYGLGGADDPLYSINMAGYPVGSLLN